MLDSFRENSLINVKMDESIVESDSAIEEQSEASGTPVLISDQSSMPPPPVPKKKGRPAGSQDKAPRKKPLVKVRIEPIMREAVITEPIATEPAPKVTPPPEHHSEIVPEIHEEPPSPMSLYKRFTRDAIHMRNFMKEQQREKAGETYVNKLHMMPV